MTFDLKGFFSELFGLNWRYILVRTVSNVLILGSLVYFASIFWEIGKQEILYAYWQWRGVEFTVDEGAEEVTEPTNPFAAFLNSPTPLKITPQSKSFGLVIEKIRVNAPVVADVDHSNKAAYFYALESGVAHARGSVRPGESGNCYLFAHSSLDVWNYGPYAGVFNLLRKLEKGDRVVAFYKGERYDYEVTKNEVVSGYDLTPLTRTFSTPYLTLQTCDPPGVALNRRVVTAKLKPYPKN
jgi:LPXTG-site transpeptidase (sortase) family protein